MIIKRIEDSEKGWFVGNFPKAAFQTDACEVSYRIHKQGDSWDLHYQEQITEINLLIKGKMRMQGKELNTGDVFIIYPYEISDPEFLEDCMIVCVKVPGIQNDKVIVTKV